MQMSYWELLHTFNCGRLSLDEEGPEEVDSADDDTSVLSEESLDSGWKVRWREQILIINIVTFK